VQAELEAVWQKVVDAWDEPARHDALMGLVAQQNAFAWAASKYKERAGDPVADKQLERIRKAAVASMFATSSKKRGTDSPYRRTMVIFVVLLVMLLIGLVGLKMIHDTKVNTPTPSPEVTKPGSH
jgi:hypothetical protein